MKITLIMFVKRVERVYCGGMRLLVHRPTYAIMTVYETSSKQYVDTFVVPLQNDKLPPNLINLLFGSGPVVAWNDVDYTILQALLIERNIKDGTLDKWNIKKDLRANGIPCSSLAAAAAEFGLGRCPREGVISLTKALMRFAVFKGVVKKLIDKMQSDLFDYILI